MQNRAEIKKWNRNKTLKILAIGNSFSDDALWLLPDIFKGLGIEEFIVSNLYIGGCVLQLHWDNIVNDSPSYVENTNKNGVWMTKPNSTLSSVLMSEEWDFITLQQGSHDSGWAQTYACLPEIIDYVKTNKPNAKLGWHMTWAYQHDSTHWAFSRYDSDQATMYNAIVNAVKSEIVPKGEIEFIVPSGTAIQNARASFLGDTLTRDGFHLSYDIGRYIAGLSYARTVTGRQINSVDFAPLRISEKVRSVCIESVNNAIKNPFMVTK